MKEKGSKDGKEKKARFNRESFKKSLQLYKYIKPYRGEFAVGLVFLLLSSAANLAFPKYLGELVDATNSEAIFENIQEISLILIGILIAQAIVSFFNL